MILGLVGGAVWFTQPHRAPGEVWRQQTGDQPLCWASDSRGFYVQLRPVGSDSVVLQRVGLDGQRDPAFVLAGLDGLADEVAGASVVAIDERRLGLGLADAAVLVDLDSPDEPPLQLRFPTPSRHAEPLMSTCDELTPLSLQVDRKRDELVVVGEVPEGCRDLAGGVAAWARYSLAPLTDEERDRVERATGRPERLPLSTGVVPFPGRSPLAKGEATRAFVTEGGQSFEQEATQSHILSPWLSQDGRWVMYFFEPEPAGSGPLRWVVATTRPTKAACKPGGWVSARPVQPVEGSFVSWGQREGRTVLVIEREPGGRRQTLTLPADVADVTEEWHLSAHAGGRLIVAEDRYRAGPLHRIHELRWWVLTLPHDPFAVLEGTSVSVASAMSLQVRYLPGGWAVGDHMQNLSIGISPDGRFLLLTQHEHGGGPTEALRLIDLHAAATDREKTREVDD